MQVASKNEYKRLKNLTDSLRLFSKGDSVSAIKKTVEAVADMHVDIGMLMTSKVALYLDAVRGNLPKKERKTLMLINRVLDKWERIIAEYSGKNNFILLEESNSGLAVVPADEAPFTPPSQRVKNLPKELRIQIPPAKVRADLVDPNISASAASSDSEHIEPPPSEAHRKVTRRAYIDDSDEEDTTKSADMTNDLSSSNLPDEPDPSNSEDFQQLDKESERSRKIREKKRRRQVRIHEENMREEQANAEKEKKTASVPSVPEADPKPADAEPQESVAPVKRKKSVTWADSVDVQLEERKKNVDGKVKEGPQAFDVPRRPCSWDDDIEDPAPTPRRIINISSTSRENKDGSLNMPLDAILDEMSGLKETPRRPEKIAVSPRGNALDSLSQLPGTSGTSRHRQSIFARAFIAPKQPKIIPSRPPSSIFSSSRISMETRKRSAACIAKYLQKASTSTAATIVQEKAREVEEAIFYAYPHKTYVSEVRSRINNLQRNEKLAVDVLAGSIDAERFAKMTVDEMATDELRDFRNRVREKSLREHQLPAPPLQSSGSSSYLSCPQCEGNNCTYTELQTQRGDEPTTTYIFCRSCNKTFRENN